MPSLAAYHADMPRNKALKVVVGDNVQAVMTAKKVKQQQVAALAKQRGHKIDQTTVGRIARAAIPTTVEKLEAVAAGLGIDPWQLLVPDLDPKNPPVFGEAALMSDERELLQNYRHAKGRWQAALLLMSRLQGDPEQDEAAGTMTSVLAKIAKDPASNERVKETLLTSRHGFPPGAHTVQQPGAKYKKEK